MDISGIENQILQALGVVLSVAVMVLIQRTYAWFGLKVTAEQTASLNAAVGNSLTFGVTQAENVIKEKGWDHVDTKNAVITTAVQAMENKFPEALSGVGLDMTKPQDVENLTDMMQRMIPKVFLEASNSPSTPPTEIQKAEIVAASLPVGTVTVTNTGTVG